jgi:hypothetical protein
MILGNVYEAWHSEPIQTAFLLDHVLPVHVLTMIVTTRNENNRKRSIAD